MSAPLGDASVTSTCVAGDKLTGTCDVTGSIDDDDVVLTGGGGSSDETGSEGDGNGGGARDSSDDGSGEGAPCGEFDDPTTVACDPRDELDVVVITIADIARFHPTPARQRMEPDGWVVVGLPANIYAVTGSHVVPGTLLGLPAQVRFTPAAYRWDYGDGTRATLGTKGGPWASLDLDEFDPTPTSHIYRAAGDYTIRLDVVFRAEYRIAGGVWVPVIGTITLPANELHITAGGAKTVLVDRDCTLAPRGPGC